MFKKKKKEVERFSDEWFLNVFEKYDVFSIEVNKEDFKILQRLGEVDHDDFGNPIIFRKPVRIKKAGQFAVVLNEYLYETQSIDKVYL
jgi:hypothetical protein